MNFSAIISQTLTYSLPIGIAGLGGLFSERSGVTNIALEGLMMIGAFIAASITVVLESTTNIAPWLAIFVAALISGAVAIIHAFISVNMKGDQIISATALNFFAVGSTIYFCEMFFGQQRTESFQRGFAKISIPVLQDIPIIGDMFFRNIYAPVYLGVVCIALAWFVISKTTFGLRLRATGEHPKAVDSAGINVTHMRYAGVIISGFCAGLAGGIMVLTQDTQYSISSIHGTGFIALAALIFGQWKPLGVMGASLFFGFSQILVIYSDTISFLQFLPLEAFKALPYVLTLVALVSFSHKTIVPKALGIPYEKGER